MSHYNIVVHLIVSITSHCAALEIISHLFHGVCARNYHVTSDVKQHHRKTVQFMKYAFLVSPEIAVLADRAGWLTNSITLRWLQPDICVPASIHNLQTARQQERQMAAAIDRSFLYCS